MDSEWINKKDFKEILNIFSSEDTDDLDSEKTEKMKTQLYYSESLLLETSLISKTDKFGRITYANDKFCKVSGYDISEILNQDHKIVNSGIHPKKFWEEMYYVTLKKRKIWYSTVTNKSKNGDLYWVKSWIQAMFDKNDKFTGFISLRQDVTDLIKANEEITKKNTYLEHAAKILRHDMHSGINTYIPRGISSIQRRLNGEVIEKYKLSSPLKMLKDGLEHTQKVYKGVYEFTNLVKPNSKLSKENHDLKEIITNFLKNTSYNQQVIIEELGRLDVNNSLFCTAIDNLIRNGLKYNDNDTKFIKLYRENNNIIIQDNGRGMTKEEFEELSKPYKRKENQKESGSGLGLNICMEILKEHGFKVTCEKNEIGTKIIIII